MTRGLRIAVLVAFALMGAEAGATTVVPYDLAGTTLQITNPIPLTVPADQISGGMTLHYADDGSGNILMDAMSAVTVDSFALSMNLNLLFGIITGTVDTVLQAPVAGGALASDGTLSFAAAPLATFLTTGVINCGGTAFVCGLAGLVPGANPINVNTVDLFPDFAVTNGTAPFDPSADPATNPHAATGTLSVTAPVVGDFSLVANEVVPGRTLIPSSVPEAGAVWMAGGGMLGLVLYGNRRRREAVMTAQTTAC